jgi:glycerophosphoryl diester phosphodiesterase
MGFFSQFNKPHLIASHRGFRAIYPENSMLAFKKAVGKCDFLEFDVQFTKDDIPVIFHDDKLIRTTNARNTDSFKKPYNLCDYTYKQLQELEISSWFYEIDPFYQRNRLKKPKKLEKIPKLEQVIKLAKKKELPINIELKFDQNHVLGKEQLQTIVDLIVKYQFENKAIVSSFCHEYLKIIKTLEPSIHTAALAQKKFKGEIIEYLKGLEVEAYHINEKLACKKLIKQLKKANFYVNVYTVNDKHKQQKLFNIGVDGIFTDFL